MPNNGNIQNDTVRDPGFAPHEDIILRNVMDRAYDNGLHFDIPFSPTIHLQSGWNIAHFEVSIEHWHKRRVIGPDLRFQKYGSGLY